jgi:EAL domain-containing protein (putative c-di-GMP-specific phosphodiesterase class I)
LKVDRSFVEEMMTGSGAAIVRATVDLGHRLDLRVVAEGVERRDQLEALAGMGCDLAQGYHVARPMAPVDMLAWLKVQSAQAAEGSGGGGAVLPLRRPRP